MRFMRAIGMTVLAALAAAPGMVSAQQVLTLDDCIDLALKNRAAVIAARGDYEIAKWDKVYAIGQFLPTVNAGYSYTDYRNWDQEAEQLVVTETDTVSWEGTLMDDSPVTLRQEIPRATERRTVPIDDDEGTNKDLSISARLSLFNVPNWFDLAAAGAAKEQARLNVLASEQDMVKSVKIAYYLYLAAVEGVAVDSEAVKRSEEQLKLIESKYELGSASRSDVLKQRVQMGNDRLTLLRSENSVVTTRAELAYVVGVDPRADVGFSTDYPRRSYEGGLDEAIQYAMEHNPALLASGKSVDAARHSVKAAWATYLPTLTGSASMSANDGTRGDTVTYDFSSKSRTFGLSLNWTIFDGFLRERQVAWAKVSLNNARAYRVDQLNSTVAQVKSFYLEIKQVQEQLTVAGETVAAAEEDMRITQEKYNLGAATILDLLDAQVSLKEAQLGLIRANFDLNLAIARLESAMGKV
ncbi:MAG TPA: TolC family protein [candidate division Zixibacteria bacterium]|nr:TolC family protein [candidate division Zixibacteria bacterium]MDD4918913.1 TolC family protein [candidate division Zixibacteria bacterium]MDM7972260.1 TolC family protein [candidate division Zixibacteria bacterium]HOD66619.1 TolC family protein [candidate division Zixibacteria bacterium]HPM35942.1 TolC family protein [candidate division Zixibacteria bacterium]